MGLIQTVISEASRISHIDPSKMVAIHETAMQIMGIDNNVIPYGYDFVIPKVPYLLLSDPEMKCEGSRYKLHVESTVRIRFWTEVRALKLKELRPRPFDGTTVLLPPIEKLLDIFPCSPDFKYLQEQYAYLAGVVHGDDMTDEELETFISYVRRPHRS